jgi:nitrate reductase delta subunit
MTRDPEALRLLSELLSYPSAGLAARAVRCARALLQTHPSAARALLRFAELAQATRLATLEEAYTDAFELSPLCSPYVGDQLFGASRERSFFLSGLRGLLWDAGLREGTELPDHVSELLRLLAAPLDDGIREDLVREALLPTLRKMRAVLDEARHPWADVVQAAADAIDPRVAEEPERALEARP